MFFDAERSTPLGWMILDWRAPVAEPVSPTSPKSPTPPKAPSSRCGAQAAAARSAPPGAAPQPLEIGPLFRPVRLVSAYGTTPPCWSLRGS